MRQDLTIEQNLLADYMSEISERCYTAGWMTNLEYVLWDSFSSGPRKYGQDFITQQDINLLKKLTEAANSWIFFDDLLDEIALDLKDWEAKFINDKQNNTQILKG